MERTHAPFPSPDPSLSVSANTHPSGSFVVRVSINLIANTLTLAGAALLLAALFRVLHLTRELAASAIARRWYFLEALILSFILGYLGYAIIFWSHRDNWHDMIIPAIFFFGAVFVWLVSALALQTVLDMRRVALLERETITDPLTGLYNRRYLERRLAAEYGRARRYKQPLSILMLDIDHFKRLNDNHGHQAGDLALNFLSKLILDGIREADIAARYGGEEIVVIAPHTPVSAASELAERLRRRIESHELELASAGQHRQALHITVSIGVATLDAGVETGEQLIHHADQALYQAKQSGRNRTALYRNAPV